MQFIRLLSLLFLLGAAVAHPGELEEHGTPRRREFLSYAKRSIGSCQDQIAARGLASRAIQRRSYLASELRKKRGLPNMRKRDLDTVLNTNHLSDLTGLTADSPAADIFTGNLSCVLQPEVTQGPYYVDGELVRKSAVEKQEGLPTYVDIQLLDVNTCEPVTNAYMDLWHCNSTGVYSGVVASGNGDSSDATNINATFLRALQPTDADGVAYFETIFPGHYTGRATHMHLVATLDATLLANNTIDGGYVSHVGQAFFDQDLINAVDTLAPYSNNVQPLTLNSEDSILSEEAGDMDPVVQYTLLGDSLSDGILAWITIGVDSTAHYNISSASTLTENGGVANENNDIGGGPGGGPGGNGTTPPDGQNGTFPSGTIPSGVIPSGSGIPSDLPISSDSVIATSTDLITVSSANPVETVTSSAIEIVTSLSAAVSSSSSSRFATSKTSSSQPSASRKPGNTNPPSGNNGKPQDGHNPGNGNGGGNDGGQPGRQ